jgi:hypothetical protein
MEPRTRRRLLWTDEQTDRLAQAVIDFGEQDWVAVANAVGLDRNASGGRWIEVIAKLNRTRWDVEEERALVRLVEEKKTTTIPWAFIGRTLGTGRTGKQCQYRYGVIQKREAERSVENLGKMLKTSLLSPVAPVVQDQHSDWDEEPDWQLETW